jgi:type I restriction enzyme R subunit
MPSTSNEAFARAKIDALLKDVRWSLTDGKSVRFEYVLCNGVRADCVLTDRHGRSLAEVEAKRSSANTASTQSNAATPQVIITRRLANVCRAV